MKTILKPVLLTSVVLAGIYTSPAKACDSEPLIGSLCTFAFNFTPRGWAMADGQILSINQNQAVFSLFGTTYGGDGRTSFALPDLRGRGVIAPGQGLGLTNYSWGQRVGVESVALTAAQIPAHTHSASTTISVNIADDNDSVTAVAVLKGATSLGDSATPSAAIFAPNVGSANAYSTATPDVALDADSIAVSLSGSTNATVTTTITPAGAGQAHSNRMPYQTLTWAIALQGQFPSRS